MTHKRPLAIIVAVAENGVIGRDNDLPWKIPADMAHFKRITMGKPLVMGRKTYESIGRPLPGRSNIVITRNPDFSAPGIEVVPSLEEAVLRAQSVARADGAEEVIVMGGAEIYRVSLPAADRLYVTEVHAAIEGDAHQDLDLSAWREISRSYHDAGPQSSGLAYSFVQYGRPQERKL